MKPRLDTRPSAPGLGAQFVAEMERCVRRAAEEPQLYAVQKHDIRRVTAERFLYSVHFRAEAGRIVVLAVFHGSRAPTVWHSRA